MDAERWERVQSLFHRAVDLAQADRADFLRRECGGDAALVKDVESLLMEDLRSGSILDRSMESVAKGIFANSAAAALPTGRFGPYRMKGILGEGGMGVVYLAEREDLGSLAAIKILRDASLSPARRERFVSEQRTLAQLNHPSIARLYDADTLADGTPWFAMEYVEGVPLTDYCRARGSGLDERLRLFRAVCEAVLHAHQHLVVHRDLKPSNILVRQDGTVKLLDFGIAKQLESLDAPADLTRTGLRVMTPAYAAPEQVRGERVGIQTDVYSLGVVLYELLAGRLPFDLANASPAEAEAILLDRSAERPSAVVRRGAAATTGTLVAGSATWADLDVLCLTAMHKDQERRYASVDALIRDVDHFLAGEPLDARPDTVGYRVSKFVGRNRRAVAATTLALVAVVVLTVVYAVRLTTARNDAVAEAARTQRIQRFMTQLFEGGDEAAGPAESLRVLTMVDRGLQEARSLDNEPAVQAELLGTLGGIYQKLGTLPRSDSLLTAALAQRRRLFGEQSPEVATSLVSLGLLRVDQADYKEAERLVRQGLAMSRATRPADHPEVAEATDALGRVLEEKGSYDDAIPILEEAVRLRAVRGVDTPEYAASVYELANVQFYAGHLDASDSLNREVLAIHKRIYGEHHPSVSDDLINLGAGQHERGKYAEAERFFRQALEITRGFYGPDHYKTASNLTMIGRSLVLQRRYDEADSLLRHALAIQERIFGRVHPKVASALNELGSVALQQSRYDAAAATYTRVVDIYRKVYNDRHYVIGIAKANLASVYMAQRNNAKAEPLFREALAMYALTLPPDHVNVGISRIKLGRVLMRERRFRDGERETRAGYDLLSKTMEPGVSWLRSAREDLATDYDSLGQKETAAKFRAEIAAQAKKDSAAAKPK